MLPQTTLVAMKEARCAIAMAHHAITFTTPTTAIARATAAGTTTQIVAPMTGAAVVVMAEDTAVAMVMATGAVIVSVLLVTVKELVAVSGTGVVIDAKAITKREFNRREAA